MTSRASKLSLARGARPWNLSRFEPAKAETGGEHERAAGEKAGAEPLAEHEAACERSHHGHAQRHGGCELHAGAAITAREVVVPQEGERAHREGKRRFTRSE